MSAALHALRRCVSLEAFGFTSALRVIVGANFLSYYYSRLRLNNLAMVYSPKLRGKQPAPLV